jgi:hypothetical protein
MSILSADWFLDLSNKDRVRAATPATLPRTRRGEWKPDGYLPDEGLADAMRVALILRKPLLLTGEPGTGKTECASYLAWKLGYGDRLIFEAKSNAEARDLFYTSTRWAVFTRKIITAPNRTPDVSFTTTPLAKPSCRRASGGKWKESYRRMTGPIGVRRSPWC